jgi:hypothetical protein
MEQQHHKIIIPAVLIGIVAAGIAFFGGVKYAESKKAPIDSRSTARGTFNTTGTAGFNGGGTRRGMAGGQGFGGAVAGDIIARDESTITVKMRDGGSKIVFYTSSTPITKTVRATASDLVAGEPIMITGAANQDGSINAQAIQLRPSFPSTTRQ